MENDGYVRLTHTEPVHFLSFHMDGLEVGYMDWIDGKLIFEGKLEESAKAFFNQVSNMLERQIETEVQKRIEDRCYRLAPL